MSILALGEWTENHCVCVHTQVCVYLCVQVLNLAISYLSSFNHCVLTSAENSNSTDFSILDAMILLMQPQSTLFSPKVTLCLVSELLVNWYRQLFFARTDVNSNRPDSTVVRLNFLELKHSIFFLVTFHLVLHTTLYCLLCIS